VGTLGTVDKEGFAAHAAERPNGRIDPAGDELEGFCKKS
jgi:hypothetical protein